MSLVITKDCYPLADKCHNCLRKDTTEVRKKPDAVKDYKRCGNCHVLTYCDRDCQREHWNKVHRSHCRFLSGKLQVKNSEHNPTSCIRCIKERESSPTQLKSGNSPSTVCNVVADATEMKKKLSQTFGFHEEGKKDHCSREFPFELPFPLEEVSGQYLEMGSTGLDVMLAHSLMILNAMFIKAHEEELKNALCQLWFDIIGARSQLWFDILVSGMPRFRARKQLSEQVDNLKNIYDASNPWWKSLKFSVDFIVKTNVNLSSNFTDFHSLLDPRFQKFKQLQDYYQSQIQNQAIVSEKQMWSNFMLWPTIVNGSLAVLLPPSTCCQSCCSELCGEVAVTPYEVNTKSLPWFLSDVGDNGALMASCPLIKNLNCGKDCFFKNVEAQILSDEYSRKKLSKERELFIIESRECDFCSMCSLSSHRCSVCRSVQYCSTVCQMKDLDFHLSVCATWAKDKSRRIKGKDGQMDHGKSVVGEK